MANAIVGSAKLLLLATLIGVPIGFLGGVYLAEFGGTTFSFVVRYVTDLLNGVPSIVIGIFAYTLIVLPHEHFSTLAGGLALGVMMIPIAVRSTEEFLRAVPGVAARRRHGAGRVQGQDDRHGGDSGGEARDHHRHHAESGARGRRDRAAAVHQLRQPLLEPGLEQPTASLPVMIYTYAIAPYEDWHRQAWAAGFVLLMLVLADQRYRARLILSQERSTSAR